VFAPPETLCQSLWPLSKQPQPLWTFRCQNCSCITLPVYLRLFHFLSFLPRTCGLSHKRSWSSSKQANMYTPRTLQNGPVTPVLDPIPDDYEGDSNDASPELEEPLNMLSEPFAMLDLDEEEEEEVDETMPNPDMTHDNPQLQMPQPRPFAPGHAAPSAMLIAVGPNTPPRSTISPQFQQYQPFTNSSPRLHPNTPNPFLYALPMVRAHSLPSVHSSPLLSTLPRSSSPLRSPKRVRSPLRHVSADDIYTFGSSAGASTLSPEISSISEDAELEITPRIRQHPHTFSFSVSSGTFPYSSQTFPRPLLRRRPASPLRSLGSSRASSVPASPIPPTAARFTESFPSDLPYSRSSLSLSTSSSMPSTPTSVRSRSPSISSLETIPDTPDAERRAMEQDSQDREERKRMWDLYGAPAQAAAAASSSSGARSSGFGARDKRKRWSVCGAEKRSDLNLETIWED
jgi:hypothetical protein